MIRDLLNTEESILICFVCHSQFIRSFSVEMGWCADGREPGCVDVVL